MSNITSIHPDAVLDALMAKPHRSNVKRTLIALHDLCRKHHNAGLRDFSVACIGRKAEAAGLIGSRSLYNPGSHVYRDLILAWAAYAGPPMLPPSKPLANNDYLLKIPDPAVRMIMQAIISERDTLRAQLNLLKGNSLGTIDLRPGRSECLPSLVGSAAGTPLLSAHLTEDEREALGTAISPKKLQEEGWVEGARGEIRVERTNRIVFERGFAHAIRKVFGDYPAEVKDVTGQ